MNRYVSLWLLLLLIPRHVEAAQLTDDRAITVHSAPDVIAKRRQLIDYLWGTNGFPNNQLPKVSTNVPSPVAHLSKLKRVDEFRIEMEPGLEGLAYHFIPEDPQGALVVVHHGHACSMNDDPSPTDVGYGLQRTIQALLSEGYGVLGVFMPRMQPGDCRGRHEALFQIKTSGSPMKYFLEPTAISLNYLQAHSRDTHFPSYHTFHMTGLSGGGWTTTVYAAIDPRIRCSLSVAGTIPLYLRTGGSVGDQEQFEPSFYSLAGYPDLYVLGAHGPGRRQVQILVRRDDCCFGEAQHDSTAAGAPYAPAMRTYETNVQAALKKTGSGQFQLAIDETAPSHMISHRTIKEVLLPVLRTAVK